MKTLFSEEKTNLGRQMEFDYAKLIAIVFMVLIHVWEEFTNIDLSVAPKGFIDNFMEFFAGPLAAPVFMIAMGMGMSYSKHRSPNDLFKRGLNIFLLSYVLNFFRSTLLYLTVTLINHSFVTVNFRYYLLNGDILQFAGLAFMFIALMKKLNVPVLGVLSLSVIMQVIGTCLAKIVVVDNILLFLTGLFIKSDYMCFPFLNWIIYPSIGLTLAKYLRHLSDKDTFYKFLLCFSFVGLLGYATTLYLNGYDLRNIYGLHNDVYYLQDFIKTLFILLTMLLEVSIIHFIFKYLHSDKLDKIAMFASKNLNTIYIIQWLIIGNLSVLCNEFSIFELIPVNISFVVGIIILVVSFVLTKLHLKR